MQKLTGVLLQKKPIGPKSLVIAIILLACLPSASTGFHDFDSKQMILADSQREFALVEGDQLIITVVYNDTWHDTPIPNATVLVNSSDENIVEVNSVQPDENLLGVYLISIYARSHGIATLTVNMSKLGFETQIETLIIEVYWEGPWPPPPPIFGFPISVFVVLLIGYFVWKENKSVDDADSIVEGNTSLVDEISEEPEDGAPGGI